LLKKNAPLFFFFKLVFLIVKKKKKKKMMPFETHKTKTIFHAKRVGKKKQTIDKI